MPKDNTINITIDDSEVDRLIDKLKEARKQAKMLQEELDKLDKQNID